MRFRPVRSRPDGVGPERVRADETEQKAPLGELVDIMVVGAACTYLATPLARPGRHRLPA
jgi:hypothetical protein